MLDVRIYEVLYTSGQQISDGLYTPLNIDNNNPSWRELQAFIKTFRSDLFLGNGLTGIFSPKFSLKTKVKLASYLEFVSDNPDYDVYIINPFPQIAYFSYNVWMQGESAHPGLTRIAQDLLDAVGIIWDLSETPRQNAKTLAYANFWVGNANFWNSFVGCVLNPIATFIEKNPYDKVVRQAFTQTLHTESAPFLPFIVERLFSTFLSFNQDISIASYPIDTKTISETYCMNDFERIMLSYMREEVEQQDMLEKKYSDMLINKMQMLTDLRQQHFFDYYTSRPHPHTGSNVTI